MELNERHHKLIAMLVDMDDHRSKDEKCVEAGFTPKYVYILQKDSDFMEALNLAFIKARTMGKIQVYRNLLRDSNKGDTQAGKTYLTGEGDIVGGTHVQTVVNQGGDSRDFADRLREARAERDVAYEREKALREDTD